LVLHGPINHTVIAIEGRVGLLKISSANHFTKQLNPILFNRHTDYIMVRVFHPNMHHGINKHMERPQPTFSRQHHKTYNQPSEYPYSSVVAGNHRGQLLTTWKLPQSAQYTTYMLFHTFYF
jgi:hypothetical protein